MADEIPLLTSAVIPPDFRHGFSSRAGGVSAGPYQSLNLGMRWGDARENVLENRRRLQQATQASALYLAAQVHGAEIAVVRAGETPADLARRQADGVCSDLPGVAVGIYVADCVPALLADPRTGAFAAVHAGWRGTVASILPAAVSALGREYGARPQDLRVALGPCIGPCCFEVGPEVAAVFPAESVIERPGRKPHVDLRRTLRAQLLAAGLRPDFIDSDGPCTVCDSEGRFFSYRRDAGVTGQHVGFIARAG
jgi:YfiH family protein